jgi:hypothetical protein
MAHHYVNNKELYQALVQYNELKKTVDNPRIPEYIGKCILLITSKLSSRGNFVNYSYKDEMVSDAIENCLAAVDNFNVDKYDNPHAYFTQIAWFAFIRRIDKEKKQNYLKYKNYRLQIAQEELTNMNMSYNPAIQAQDEIMDEFIRSYEENVERKKKKTKKKQGVEKFIKDDGNE